MKLEKDEGVVIQKIQAELIKGIDPSKVIELPVGLSVPFESPGIYSFDFYMNGELLASRKLTVRHQQPDGRTDEVPPPPKRPA